MSAISKLNRLQANALYHSVLIDNDTKAMRQLILDDLFYLLVVGCKRRDMQNDWVYERVREVEAAPDGYLDLWAREHFKSSIITFGLSVQNILSDPNITIGIFSHTRPIAKAFLGQIKREFETNTFLKGLFPDVLYTNPQRESPKWSLDDGIIVKRNSNPKESTVEAWGLVDGQPTSKHYGLMVYDDVVTKESVSTPEMIAKVTESFGLSMNLAGKDSRKRYVGTRYHQNDTYKTVLDRGTATPRIYPATDDGTVTGSPVLLSQKNLDDKFRDMGSYIFSAQMLLNPMADKAMGFKKEWLEFFSILRKSEKWNFYVLVDPASKKKLSSDYTVIVVIGLAPDGNYYLVDGIRDRMNLTERTNKVFEFVKAWKPLKVGYEEYAMQCDIEHIKYVQEQEGYRFMIIALGGSMAKNDRIRRLVPLFENRRFYLPYKMLFVSVDGKAVDFIYEFINNEYDSFPVCLHDDMLDCISRILDSDLSAKAPLNSEPVPLSIASAPVKEYHPFDRADPTPALTNNIIQPTSLTTWRDAMRVK